MLVPVVAEDKTTLGLVAFNTGNAIEPVVYDV